MSLRVLYSALPLMVLIFVHRPSLSHLLVSHFLLPLLLVPFVSPTSYFRTFYSFYTLFSWAHFCVYSIRQKSKLWFLLETTLALPSLLLYCALPINQSNSNCKTLSPCGPLVSSFQTSFDDGLDAIRIDYFRYIKVST